MKWYSSYALILKWPHVNFLLVGISVDRGQQALYVACLETLVKDV